MRKTQRETLPGLFGPEPQLPAPSHVNALRDDAMETVAAHAERTMPGFTAKAREFVLEYLCDHGPTAGELLTIRAKQAGLVPHDDRAFGPVYNVLARRALIERVGTVRRERGHGTEGGNVWDITGAGRWAIGR